MATTAKARIRSVQMPAGTYWIGDPCYAVPNDRWMEWLQAADYENQDVLIADLDGRPVLGIGTAYGDGTYPGDDGNSYPVDAGLIGAVPIELVDGEPDGMAKVTFAAAFDCESTDGLISIGHIDIDTDPDEEPEDDGYEWDEADDEEED